MTRKATSQCCKKHDGVKKGPWTPHEDTLLVDFIQNNNGHGNWTSLPHLAGLDRCGKSCRLRWTNYLRPDIKRGPFTREEDKSIIWLHGLLGNRWSAIATKLRGRTDNEIKNYWNTCLRKRLVKMKIDPDSLFSSETLKPNCPTTRHKVEWECVRLETEARLSKQQQQVKHSPDLFLGLWHSEVGDSFRNVVNQQVKQDFSFCSYSSSSSSTSSSNRRCVGSLSGFIKARCFDDTQEVDQVSDAALELLLDYPCDEEDATFLH